MITENLIKEPTNVNGQTSTNLHTPVTNGGKTMKALVYGGPGTIELKDVNIPTLIKQTDAIIRILKTTICGTDLGISHGKVPSVMPGTTLGHEGVGVVEQAGEAVRNFAKGDHVIISCITSDGSCEYCKKGLYAHCEDGGWILGNTINGTQAEFVRIPHADNSLHHIPEGSDEEALVMLSDILPTGFEIGVLNGQIKPGDIVAVVGAGPVGMAVLLTAQFYSPSKIYVIDIDDNRLELAKKFGATDTINSAKENVLQRLFAENKSGVDVSVEAVGLPETFDVCQNMIRPGGHIAVVGVHGKSVDFQLQKLWIQNITLTTGLVSTNTTPMLLRTVTSGMLKPAQLITHHFTLDNILEAYKVFGNAAEEKAMKVIIKP
ncbi:MAG: Alcohol dehydrogenase GroES domain protein [Pedobacter sp.]|jgi:alcohol dehydrogenase|nr:Alcohol dehydrogenase GroES domain protein [Pedobacter sp.]